MVTDGSLVLRDGRLVSVPRSSVSVFRWGLSTPTGGLWGHKLAMSGPDLVVLRRIFRPIGLVSCLVPMAVGAIFASAIYWRLQEPEARISVGVVLGFVLFAGGAGLCFLIGLALAFQCTSYLRRFRADQRSRTVTLVTADGENRHLGFGDVAAVQITWCGVYWVDSDGDERNSQTWQINLVLEEPPLERIPLVNRTGRRKAYAEAESLAGFFDVPLIDHTE